MGGCASTMSGDTRVIEVKSIKPDEPETLRVKLTGRGDSVTPALLKKQICESQQEFSNRFTVEGTKQAEFYLVTTNTLPGDDPGTVASVSKKLQTTINKETLPIHDKCKIVSWKLYDLIGEDD